LPLLYPITTERRPTILGIARRFKVFSMKRRPRWRHISTPDETVAVLSEGDPLFFGSYMHLHCTA